MVFTIADVEPVVVHPDAVRAFEAFSDGGEGAGLQIEALNAVVFGVGEVKSAVVKGHTLGSDGGDLLDGACRFVDLEDGVALAKSKVEGTGGVAGEGAGTAIAIAGDGPCFSDTGAGVVADDTVISGVADEKGAVGSPFDRVRLAESTNFEVAPVAVDGSIAHVHPDEAA